MPTNRVYPCPACGREVARHEATCPDCELDLRVVALLNEVPDVCFNAALTAAKREQWVSALRSLAAAIHYRPADAGAWILLGKVLARLGREPEAHLCFEKASELSPPPQAAPTRRDGPPELKFLRGI